MSKAPRNSGSTTLLSVLVVGILGFGAFVLGQLASSGAQDVGADPEDQIEYGETVERLFIADDQKAKFRGDLNGIRFVDSSQRPDAATRSPKCEGTDIVQVWGKDLEGLELDFEVTYLPLRAKPDFAVASLCDDDVILVQKAYSLDKGGFVSIERQTGPASFATSAPAERLKAETVGKRRAVVSHPVVPMDRAEVFLQEGATSFRISSMNLSLDELLKVAEGVNSK